jgi:hypothetical protein
MQPDANTAHADFIADITRGLLAGLAQRPGEPSARRDAYAASLAFCVMAFQPRDMPELTAANHCLRFHYVLDDAIDDMLNEPDNLIRRKLRPSVNATGRISFSHNREFTRLRRRKPDELVTPLSAAFVEPADAPDTDAQTRPAASGRAASARAGFMPTQADIAAAAKIMAARFARTPGTEAPPGDFPVPSPAIPEYWACPSSPPLDATAARSLAERFVPTTTPPAVEPRPEPAPSLTPTNRAQRRLAMKPERTKARRAAAIASHPSRGPR